MIYEALTAFTEIGVGIAGFSSIVVTLGRSGLTADVKRGFTILWFQCIAIMLFSLVPFWLKSSMDDIETFVVASKIFAVYLLIVVPIAMYAAFKVSGLRPPVSGIPAIALQPTLLLVNAFFVKSDWLYMLVLFLGVVFAFIIFFTMVLSLWSSHPGPNA